MAAANLQRNAETSPDRGVFSGTSESSRIFPSKDAGWHRKPEKTPR